MSLLEDFDIEQAAMIEEITVDEITEDEIMDELDKKSESGAKDDDDEEDFGLDGEKVSDDVIFVTISQKCGSALLEKSQTPAIRAKKKVAIKSMIKHLSDRGLPHTEIQVKKKLENMKSRLKKKVDTKKTGNLPITLKPWEKILFDTMHGIDNPSIGRLKCGYRFFFIYFLFL